MLKKDIFERFPHLYKESFSELYERRNPLFKKCCNFEFGVGDLTITETLSNFYTNLVTFYFHNYNDYVCDSKDLV